MNKLNYNIHLFLNNKNKYWITILLQIFLVLILPNLVDYTYCMVNESDNGSEISSIFEYDEAYILHCVQPHLENLFDQYNRQFFENHDLNDLTVSERYLGPIFEYLKTEHPEYTTSPETFDNQPLTEKIKNLHHAYFSESVEKAVLRDCLEKQTDQLFRRQDDLLETKEIVRELTQENLELKNQINELQQALIQSLRK